MFYKIKLDMFILQLSAAFSLYFSHSNLFYIYLALFLTSNQFLFFTSSQESFYLLGFNFVWQIAFFALKTFLRFSSSHAFIFHFI